jgi:GT2 family glycosyltransferase
VADPLTDPTGTGSAPLLQPEIALDPDGPILVERPEHAEPVVRAASGEPVVLLPWPWSRNGRALTASLVVASCGEVASRARDCGVPFLLDASEPAQAALLREWDCLHLAYWDGDSLTERLQWVLDRREAMTRWRPDAAEIARQRVATSLWLAALHDEERRLQASHLENVEHARQAEREAQQHLQRHLAALEDARQAAETARLAAEARAEELGSRVDELTDHLRAVEATGALQVARLLSRGVRLLRKTRHPNGRVSIDDDRWSRSSPEIGDGRSRRDGAAPAAQPGPAAKGAPGIDSRDAEAPAGADGGEHPLPAVDLVVADGAGTPTLWSEHGLVCNVWSAAGGLTSPLPGSAPYVAVMDADAELIPSGLASALRLAEDEGLDVTLTGEAREDGEPFPKGPWSLSQGRSWCLATGLTLVRRAFVERMAGLVPEAGWEGVHDMLLRAPADARIGLSGAPGCIRSGPLGPARARDTAESLLQRDLDRRGVAARLEPVLGLPGAFMRRKRWTRLPQVSIVVPTRDQPELLERLLEGIAETRWRPLEVVLVDNRTTEPRARALLERSGHRVVRADIDFNFARLVNRGAAAAAGEVLVFLNNDVEVTDADWLEALIDHALEPDVGPVGALLRYPDGRIQHCGIGIADGVPVHLLRQQEPDLAPATLVRVPQDRTAVTAACMAIRAKTFWDLDGMEALLPQNYNDVDLCLRAAAAGLRTVYTPFADLVHRESATRRDVPLPDIAADWLLFRTRWVHVLSRPDPLWPEGFSPVDGKPIAERDGAPAPGALARAAASAA